MGNNAVVPLKPVAMTECCVCLCDMDPTEKGSVVVTNCGHTFHSDCIDQCLLCNNKCPLCRAEITLLTTLSAVCKVRTKPTAKVGLKSQKAVKRQNRAYLDRLSAIRRAARAQYKAARRAAIRSR